MFAGAIRGLHMSKRRDDPISQELQLRDYLDATSDASRRGRSIVVLLVTASILVLAGLLNSMHFAWARQRLSRIVGENPSISTADIITSKIGPLPKQGVGPTAASEYKEAMDRHEKMYETLHQEYLHHFVETAFAIKVPFFGVTFDVNDLGTLGGFSLLSLLVLLWFALSREHENLAISFRAAEHFNDLEHFYHLLAMSQVFTKPTTDYNNSGDFVRMNRRMSVVLPRVACALPFLVQLAVVVNDAFTFDQGFSVNPIHTIIVTTLEGFILLVIAIMAWRIDRSLRSTNKLWDDQWEAVMKLRKKPPPADYLQSTPAPSPA
jgi:hypothetical protein